MGYKAWVGGKSAWVSTSFGTQRGHRNETSSENFTRYDHPIPNRWQIQLKNGNSITINAGSYQEAVNIRNNMADADKKKRPIKDKRV